jgi:hypothetical protein
VVVRYVPGRVKTPLGEPRKRVEDNVRKLALERDIMAADLLEGDNWLDLLDEAIDNQLSGMAIEAPQTDLPDVRKICRGEVITYDCYKKALEMLKAAPIVANGYDPTQSIFGNELTDRTGPKLTRCQDFDPDKFYDAVDKEGNRTNGTGAAPSEALEKQKISLNDASSRAQENQKKWSMWTLFWDLIWGRGRIKDKYRAETVDHPDIGKRERPSERKHLQWETFPPLEGPIDDVTIDKKFKTKISYMDDRTAAIWVDPWDPLLLRDQTIRNKGIPAVESGFLLGLIIGFLSLVPKSISLVFKFKKKVMDKLKKVRKIPIVGKAVMKGIDFLIGIMMLTPTLINDAFIEICIWLILKPNSYNADLGNVPEDAGTFKGEVDNRGVTSKIDILSTPGGWIPLDCFKSAQTVVNTVHNDAVQ